MAFALRHLPAERCRLPGPAGRAGASAWSAVRPTNSRAVATSGRAHCPLPRFAGGAEKEYYSAQNNQYAQQIFSDEGQRNGLYWNAAAGEPQSPIGPQVAAAVAEGYVKGQAGPPTPYRGYLFHVLTRQGNHAPGGAKNFIVDGKMTEGFAFVASPAKYRSSGVMTFIVGADGVVYQKDLGKKTEALGKAMKEYGLDSTWRKAVEELQQAAREGKTP